MVIAQGYPVVNRSPAEKTRDFNNRGLLGPVNEGDGTLVRDFSPDGRTSFRVVRRDPEMLSPLCVHNEGVEDVRPVMRQVEDYGVTGR